MGLTSFFHRKELLGRYPRGGVFWDMVYRQYSAKQTMQRFRDQGVALKVEEDGRVFPVSDASVDIIAVFQTFCPFVHFVHDIVLSIQRQGKGFSLTTKQSLFFVNAVALCVGGNAYRHTGSTGDGYSWAQSL
ncbi:MAG: NAD(P)/FAD-dependent oxidoreductase [Candidatus Absconditabacterales bacterium]|nr:NAD(P)/FAD-dependent oxidoreductase [Candidatus Absconditabacterales bacterium]